jgi:hypothetical protein
MRYKSIFLTASLLVFVLSIITGCDSPTETKAVSVSSPTLVAPADNSQNVSVTPTFTWTGDADKLQVCTNTNYTTLEYSADVSGTSHTMSGHTLGSGGSVYFWRAGKTSGTTVYWSDSYRFTTN